MKPASAAARFSSLAELQHSHADLVKRVGRNPLAHLEEITKFVRNAVATGDVLDDPAERAAAQSLIGFWSARVASAHRVQADDSPKFPLLEDTLLEEFKRNEL